MKDSGLKYLKVNHCDKYLSLYLLTYQVVILEHLDVMLMFLSCLFFKVPQVLLELLAFRVYLDKM